MDDDVDALELDVDAFHDGPVHRREVRRLLVDVDIRHRQEAGVLVVGVRSVEDVKVGEKVPALDAAHLEIADDVVGSKLGFGCQRIHAEEEDLFVDVGVLLQLGEAEFDLKAQKAKTLLQLLKKEIILEIRCSWWFIKKYRI